VHYLRIIRAASSNEEKGHSWMETSMPVISPGGISDKIFSLISEIFHRGTPPLIMITLGQLHGPRGLFLAGQSPTTELSDSLLRDFFVEEAIFVHYHYIFLSDKPT
jgi:hypothetical protein